MSKKIPEDNEYFHFHNENHKRKTNQDCTYRALATFLNKSWEDIARLDMKRYLETGEKLYRAKAMRKGEIEKYIEENTNAKEIYNFLDRNNMNVDKIITIKEFIDEFAEKDKTYLITTKGHATIVKNKKVYDTWDCSRFTIHHIYEKR